MNQLGFSKSVVYHGDVRLGELDIIPVADQNFQFPNNEIRIHHLSPQSERCPPLAILQTISSYSVGCKLESLSPVEQPHLINLHASCFYEVKTAVVVIGDEEIHLVPMPSKQKKFPCFWCFAVPVALYDSCLRLLNLRCLAIVFDLDETLIVANTMKSFEDRVEALRVWIARENDPVRMHGMSAELKRYTDDRLLLKQYLESDCVVDNGKTYKVQLEEVPRLSDTHERVARPVIRLQEKNIVLTRINPEIRDTSVLVRLRPAWEDLRSYLTAKGRKRFEVYVCTMAERDYALEMWRLLDPEAHLIASNQLLDRVVCVKSGSRKSLLNVFQDGICHPKMAMVIDDRSKVWEDMDQPRVHVVPAFTPYYAPQAETANAVPVLCVARNVACNVRGYFFREFDDSLIRRISEVFYEDGVTDLPAPPDVSNYMMSEDAGFTSNGNSSAPFNNEGKSGAEVGRQFSRPDEKNMADPTTQSMSNTPILGSEISQPSVVISQNAVGPMSSTLSLPFQKPSLLGAPIKRDLRQNSDQPPLLSRVPAPISAYATKPLGGRVVEEDISRAHINDQPSGFGQETDPVKSSKPQGFQNPFAHNTRPPAPSGLPSNVPQIKGEEASSGQNRQKQGLNVASHPPEAGPMRNFTTSSNWEFQTEAWKSNLLPSHLSIGVLQEIARRCGSKVEFKFVVSTSTDFQFSAEVLFSGEKIGVGIGRTRKDAQQLAAENALHGLAEKYVAFVSPYSEGVDRDFNMLSLGNDNGFLWEVVSPGSSEAVREDGLPREHTLEAAETDFGNTSSSLSSQQLQKRSKSPRLQQSLSNKRSKEEQREEQKNGSQGPSLTKEKNGNHV